jgi:hypothetical protein
MAQAPVPLFQVQPWVTALFYAVVGLLFGVLAERTTYCIVIATHQVMGVKYSRIYEMILVGIAVSALLDGLLVASGAVPAVDAYRFFMGVGWWALVGSFIFGFGMMFGQGCMVGMLWKSGQGYIVNWFEILGMMVGTVIFAFPIFNGLNLGWWWSHYATLNAPNKSPLDYIPYLLSGFMSIRVAAALVGVLFFAGIMAAALYFRRERLKWETGKGSPWTSPYFYGTLFGLFMVASFVFMAGRGFNYLGVTTPVGLFTEYLTAPFRGFIGSASVDVNWYQTVPIANAFTFFVLMIIAGALLSAQARGTFAIRLPAPGTNRVAEIFIAFLGGIILAIGARIAEGCSVGGFWSGLAALSLYGLVYTVGIVTGSIAGYYAYVALSSWAASRGASTGSPVIRLMVGNFDASGLIASVVIGLAIAGIGVEVMAYNGYLKAKLAPAVASQWSLVLVALGLFIIVASLVINLVRARGRGA